MRILLAAKHAPHGKRPIGGVQSWCRTVARELQRRGHEAVTWGPEQPTPLGGFDFGIIANVGDTARALDWCSRTVVVSHGIIPAEAPAGGDRQVFTSEEIRDHWKGTGQVVRQPIDLDFWYPVERPPVYLTRFSYRGGLGFLPAIAESMKLFYRHVKNSSAVDARKTLYKSACVLATGRALLEAMACGVPVVLCDHRSSYQAPLMHLNLKHAMVRNYSGRGGITPNPANVREAVAVAIAGGHDPRGHVEKYHDVRKITDQLLEEA